MLGHACVENAVIVYATPLQFPCVSEKPAAEVNPHHVVSRDASWMFLDLGLERGDGVAVFCVEEADVPGVAVVHVKVPHLDVKPVDVGIRVFITTYTLASWKIDRWRPQEFLAGFAREVSSELHPLTLDLAPPMGELSLCCR